MRGLTPTMTLAAGVICAIVLAGCPKEKVTVTKTVTETHAVKVPGPAKKIVTRTLPPKIIHVPIEPRQREGAVPLPAGVFQVDDSYFLIRPGYEQNMRHLCTAKTDDPTDDTTAKVTVHVDSLSTINGDFKVVCTLSVGNKYQEIPLVTTPLPPAFALDSRVRGEGGKPHSNGHRNPGD